MRKIRFFAVLLSVSVCLSSCGLLPKEEEFQEAPVVKEYDGASYGKTQVVRGDLAETEDIKFVYQGTPRFELTAEGDMKVKEALVKVGQKVENGDSLVRYYMEAYEDKIKASQLEIKRLNMQMRHERELQNAEISKVKRVGGSSQEIQTIREQHSATISSFQTQLKIQNLELEESKAGIEENDGLSELDGRVTKIMTAIKGSTPEAQDVLVTVEGKAKNRFYAKTKYASTYKDGQEVTIDVKGQEYKAIVKKKKGDKKKMFLYMKNKGLKFESGDKCTLVHALKEKKNVLYLPSSTVFEMGDKNVVYVENKEGLKTMKEVQIGISINHLTEIISGLNEGDEVITD